MLDLWAERSGEGNWLASDEPCRGAQSEQLGHTWSAPEG